MAGLTPKQLIAVRLLAQGKTMSATAAETGVDRRTLYNWLESNTRFTHCLDALMESLRQSWAVELSAATRNGLILLNHLITSADAPTQIRLKAALAVLTRDQRGGFADSVVELALSARNRSSFREFVETNPQEDTGADRPEPASQDEDAPEIPQNPPTQPNSPEALSQNSTLSSISDEPAKQTPRSASCPCGSGQKFKRCCGRDSPPVLNAA